MNSIAHENGIGLASFFFFFFCWVSLGFCFDFAFYFYFLFSSSLSFVSWRLVMHSRVYFLAMFWMKFGLISPLSGDMFDSLSHLFMV